MLDFSGTFSDIYREALNKGKSVDFIIFTPLYEPKAVLTVKKFLEMNFFLGVNIYVRKVDPSLDDEALDDMADFTLVDEQFESAISALKKKGIQFTILKRVNESE
ncbi:hypothetical protein FFONT_0211 [Fervidicoccus fontis Kam940]|uniref:Uncharacterized protein n=2 Tax=Fervidicoccus fontis TaxID=683846 RepID=H9ZZP5_FERFK|nr:hypothetical protein FFONT_0211 [Fervidicoccus fontis Kam940]